MEDRLKESELQELQYHRDQLRRADENSGAWREYMKLHEEELKNEKNFISETKPILGQMKDLLSQYGLTLYGNGNPEKGLCYQLLAIKTEIKLLNEKINGLFKTDDWRKAFFAGAIRAISTAVIVTLMLKYLIK